MVVNYPAADVPFTRIVEYKHVPNQTLAVKEGKVRGTLIAREYSSAEGDPYYPVPNPANTALYEKYRALAEKEEGVCFVGLSSLSSAPTRVSPSLWSRAQTMAFRQLRPQKLRPHQTLYPPRVAIALACYRIGFGPPAFGYFSIFAIFSYFSAGGRNLYFPVFFLFRAGGPKPIL